MIHPDTASQTLEKWHPTVFLAAGGLFALPTVASGVSAATGTDISTSPAVVFAFLLVVFVGLLGLYPRLADRDSGLAKAGLGLLVVTAVMTTATMGVFVFSGVVTVEQATALTMVTSVAVGSTLTVTTFGIASLRTGVRPRSVGGFLLAMAAGMSVIAAALLTAGHSTPEWVGFVVNGVVAASSVSIGYVLRTGETPTERSEPTGDVTAD